jgi:hypothetical protein
VMEQEIQKEPSFHDRLKNHSAFTLAITCRAAFPVRSGPTNYMAASAAQEF